MVKSNSILLPLIFLLLTISSSFAHDKPQVPTPPPHHRHRKHHNPHPHPIPPSVVHNDTKLKGCFTKIFAFGDSFTDTGNAKLLGGLMSFRDALKQGSPYGCTFFSDSVNRFSNGRLVIDFLAEKFGLPYIPPYKNVSADFSCGVNFAISGSTAVTTEYYKQFNVGRTVKWKSVPDNLQTQIDWFNEFMGRVECKGKDENACKAEMDKVLFYIGEMGGADYTRTFGSSFTSHAITEIAINKVMKLLETVLAKGAKYVVVQGLPPSGCFPLDLSMSPKKDHDEKGCSISVNTIIMAHNLLLQSKLKLLRKLYPQCTIIYADYWRAYLTIVTNAVQFGFKEIRKACCGAGDGHLNFDLHSLCGSPGANKCADPSQYISWDGIHLTEAMYSQVAKLFFEQGFCQPSFDFLVKSKLIIS